VNNVAERVSPTCHELLVVIQRALDKSEANASTVAGVLHVLLHGGAPYEGDASLMANVLANAVEVSNDPEDAA
jgi:hypothetical protein